MSNDFVNLLSISTTYLFKSGYAEVFITAIVLDIIMNIAIVHASGVFYSGNNILIYFIGLKLVYFIFDKFIFTHISTKLTEFINLVYISDEFKRFDKLSYIDKKSISSSEFKQQLLQAKRCIISIWDWGLFQIIPIFTNVLNCIYVLKNSYILLTVIILVYYIAYVKIIKHNIKEYSQHSKTNRQNSRRLAAKSSWIFPDVIEERRSVQEVINIEHEMIQLELMGSKLWHKISRNLEITNYIVLTIIAVTLQHESLPVIIPVIIAINAFNGAVKSSVNFINQLQRITDDFTAHNKFWDKKEPMQTLDQLKLPELLIIKKTDIKLPKITISSDDIHIRRGDRILVDGPTASGKTTFIKALIAQRNGVTLQQHQPGNFTNDITYSSQDSIKTLNTKVTTMHDLFGDGNDDIIHYWLKFCCVGDFPDLNKVIDDSLSGGEAYRLVLAIRVVNMIIYRTSMLIMDEPEQGTDAKKAYEIIGGILNQFADKTIIVVSHLESKLTAFKWNMIINVDNGNVSARRT